MKGTWLSSRKDIFVRDLIQDFFAARLYFSKIHATFQQSACLPFDLLDSWVGTETQKGPLWHLKDQSHRLFRNTSDRVSLYEHLFDWAIGSIFHEAMKLKEDAYQVESYKPLLELEVSNHGHQQALSHIVQEYFSLIEKANKSLASELLNIDALFTKSLFHLREIFVLHKNNSLLLRLLLENSHTVEKLLGSSSLDEILDVMFPAGRHEAYLRAADKCLLSGRYAQAEKYLKKTLRLDKNNKTAQALLNQIAPTEE